MKKTEVITKEREEMKKVLGDLLGDLGEITVDNLGPKIIENLEQSRIVELAREKKFLLRGLKSETVKSISTQKKIYSQRLALVEEELNRKLSAAKRICRACQAGYSPFRVNPAWCGGFLEKPSLKRLQEYTEETYRDREHITVTYKPYSLFQQAIPKTLLEKYQKAKELDVFDVIMVYSPRQGDFTRVAKVTKVKVEVLPPPRPTKDPIMVGRIGLNGPVKVSYGSGKSAYVTADGDEFVTFFIGAWDIGKDLDL